MGNGSSPTPASGGFRVAIGRAGKVTFIPPGLVPKEPVNRKQRRAKAALERKKRGK